VADDPERRSTQMPWLLRIWPLAIMAIAVTAALVLLAVLIDSEITAWRCLPSPVRWAPSAWPWPPCG
jgi:hypothetical protein